jgi:hypothetical protein
VPPLTSIRLTTRALTRAEEAFVDALRDALMAGISASEVSSIGNCCPLPHRGEDLTPADVERYRAALGI